MRAQLMHVLMVSSFGAGFSTILMSGQYQADFCAIYSNIIAHYIACMHIRSHLKAFQCILRATICACQKLAAESDSKPGTDLLR